MYQNFNNENKNKARELAFENFLIENKKESPKVLILAGEFGLDAQFLRTKIKTPIIFNVEREKKILESFKKSRYGYLARFHFCGSFSTFLKSSSQNFDMIFYDSMSLGTEQFFHDLEVMNSRKSARHISVTYIKGPDRIKSFLFTKNVIEKFGTKQNAVLQTMYNYDVINNHDYYTGKYEMKLLTFKLKSNAKI